MRHKRTAPRRGRRPLIVALAVLLVLAGAGITAAWAYERSLSSNLGRTDAFAGLSESTRPTPTVTGAMNILLLGSDSRDPSSTANSRTDTIMVLHLDADHQHAYVISIPRATPGLLCRRRLTTKTGTRWPRSIRPTRGVVSH